MKTSKKIISLLLSAAIIMSAMVDMLKGWEEVKMACRSRRLRGIF